VGLQFYLLFRGSSRLTIGWQQLRINFAVLRRLVRVSITGIVQFLVVTASWVSLVRIIAHFGSAAVAGYTIAIRLVLFTLLPAWGLSNAAATLVGQNLGAGKPARAETSVYRAAMLTSAFLLMVSIIFWFLPVPIVGFFTADAAVARVGVQCLQRICFCYAIYAWGMVLVQAFNGAGDTLTPTVINFIAFWIVQIPVAWFLAFHSRMGVDGVFTAVPFADFTFTLIAVIWFRRGKWKKQLI
jgi:Na+-driven multidrug efflux pump